MMRISIPVLAVLFALGCDGDKDDTGTTTDGGATDGGGTDGGGGDGGGGDTTVAVSWGASGVTLDITNGVGSYYFGMAETDAASPDPWTGEDCYLGYTLSNGDLLSYCHPAADGSNGYTYGGDVNSLNEASETGFPDNSFEDVVTYYLESGADCWVWGHDTSYYSALGCTEI